MRSYRIYEFMGGSSALNNYVKWERLILLGGEIDGDSDVLYQKD